MGNDWGDTQEPSGRRVRYRRGSLLIIKRNNFVSTAIRQTKDGAGTRDFKPHGFGTGMGRQTFTPSVQDIFYAT